MKTYKAPLTGAQQRRMAYIGPTVGYYRRKLAVSKLKVLKTKNI